MHRQISTAAATLAAVLLLAPDGAHAAAPPAPTGVRALESPTRAAPVIAWNGVARADRYQVLRDGRLVATVARPRWTDTTLRLSGRHLYAVRAVRQGAASPRSAGAAVTYDVIAPAVITAAPTTTVPADGAGVTVSWEPVADLGGAGVVRYNVRRDGVYVGSVDSPATTFTDTSAGAGGRYVVRAEDGAGNMAASFSPEGRPADAGEPSTPAPPSPPVDAYSGVAARLGNDYSVAMKTKYPSLKLVSVELHWDTFEPAEGVFEWGRLDESLRDARDRGYKLILRVLCGFRAPAWIYRDADNPVTPVDAIPTDDGWPLKTGIRIPLPWDADLAVHYRGMIEALQAKLEQADGAGGTWADHVLFAPVAMPTIMGSEMPIGFGHGAWTGTFGGVTKTWPRAETNRGVWLRHAPSGATDAERIKAIQTAMRDAWVRAIDVQMDALTSVPSAVSFGFLFADGYAGAQWIAEHVVPRHGGRLWAMTTNLQPKLRPGGALGPWSEWCTVCDRAIRTAQAGGATIGFQTERGVVNNSASRIRFAVDDALARYRIRFLETVGPIINLDQPYFLGAGEASVQNRLATLARG
jgi:hypothetical protein